MLHHVQVAAPVGSEDRLRAFYGGVLGWPELPKPPLLAARGGCWFRVPGHGGPDAELHVGTEAGFQPARRAHPAFVVDVDAVAAAVERAGHEVRWADPAEIPGRRRFHTNDPVGNRLEFLEGLETVRRFVGVRQRSDGGHRRRVLGGGASGGVSGGG